MEFINSCKQRVGNYEEVIQEIEETKKETVLEEQIYQERTELFQKIFTKGGISLHERENTTKKLQILINQIEANIKETENSKTEAIKEYEKTERDIEHKMGHLELYMRGLQENGINT